MAPPFFLYTDNEAVLSGPSAQGLESEEVKPLNDPLGELRKRVPD